MNCYEHTFITKRDLLEDQVQKVIEKYGRVDLVFNNAGVAAPSSFVEMSEKDWNWCNDINYNAVINSSRAFLPHLLKNEESALITLPQSMASSLHQIIQFTTHQNLLFAGSQKV